MTLRAPPHSAGIRGVLHHASAYAFVLYSTRAAMLLAGGFHAQRSCHNSLLFRLKASRGTHQSGVSTQPAQESCTKLACLRWPSIGRCSLRPFPNVSLVLLLPMIHTAEATFSSILSLVPCNVPEKTCHAIPRMGKLRHTELGVFCPTAVSVGVAR